MLACANDGDVSMDSYVFEEEEINLLRHGQDGSPVKINARKFMEYLTKDAAVNDMLRDPLVVCQWDLRMKMAFAEDVVDLFDNDSWKGVDYTPLVDLVRQRIANHPLHQQRCENHVQIAGLVASTNEGEGRRSDQSNVLKFIMCDHLITDRY